MISTRYNDFELIFRKKCTGSKPTFHSRFGEWAWRQSRQKQVLVVAKFFARGKEKQTRRYSPAPEAPPPPEALERSAGSGAQGAQGDMPL
jgi:hypothetical protein